MELRRVASGCPGQRPRVGRVGSRVKSSDPVPSPELRAVAVEHECTKWHFGLKSISAWKVQYRYKTRNAWQSLACRPRGIAVTPSSEYVKQNWVVIAPQNSVLIPQGLAVAPPGERRQTADRRGVYCTSDHLELRSYWTEVYQIFKQCSHIIAREPLEMGIAIFYTPFRNSKATNKGESADFANFNPRISCHGNVLDRSEKEDQISNLRSNTYHTMKIWWKSVRCILRQFVWKVYYKERNDGFAYVKLRRYWTKVH